MPKLVEPVIGPGTFGHTVQPQIGLGGGVVLRRWELDDAEAVVGAFSDPDIQRWHVRRMDSLTEARTWVGTSHDTWASETGAWWTIALGADRVVAGRVAIYLKPEFGHAEVSYWVLPGTKLGFGYPRLRCCHPVGARRRCPSS